MNKTAIKNFAIWARRKLISDITYKAGMLGISENGVAQPLPQSTRDLQFFDIGTKDYAEVSGVEIEQRNALIKAIQGKEQSTDYKTAFRNVVEEVAYTWFNRLIAVRFMEVNDYLPSHIRVLSSENEGKLEPDFVTAPFDTDLDFSPFEKDRVYQLKDENKLDELFRMLFIKQCNKLSEILPGLFEQISDYTELLLNISFTDKDGIVYHLTHDISEDEFNVEKEGQVEIIGWMYQYYNTEPKDEVFALLKKNVKITKERIPAATQLFTPDWIVRYMVENSLGRLWVEGHPDENLKRNWKYYLEEAEQEPDVVEQLNKIREEYAKLNPVDIKVIDPCMGSGHILVYAFDVLMQIYTSQGYIERDAAKSILVNNLYGIDIDTRAYQLAYFAVMMKARQYNRKIFQENIMPNLIAIRNPADVSKSVLKRLGGLEPVGLRLIEEFEDAEEYGSILQPNVTLDELDRLEKQLEEIDRMADYGNLLVQMESTECCNLLWPLIKQARMLSQKYDVVVTNPPYMGSNGFGSHLSNYAKTFYHEVKSDLFAIMMVRCIQMSIRYVSMITQQSWMFLSSYEWLRHYVYNNNIDSLVHLGTRAFDEISGEMVATTCFSLRIQKIFNYIGHYKRLVDISGEEAKRVAFMQGASIFVDQGNYSSIPGSPTAYWVNKHIAQAFKNGESITKYIDTFQGIITGDNERFLRFWYELKIGSLALHYGCMDSVDLTHQYWIPYNKGGEFRKWYGGQDYVVNWKNGPEDKTRGRKTFSGYYLKEYVAWSYTIGTTIATRYYPKGFLWDVRGSGIMDKSDSLLYLEGLIGSKVGMALFKVNNSTLSCQVENIVQLPIIYDQVKKVDIDNIVKDCNAISQNEWDSFETSWDFWKHPLVPCLLLGSESIPVDKSNNRSVICSYWRLSDCYGIWADVCQKRFDQLKINEVKLNRFFIDIYGLQDELSPDVADNDVTFRKADLGRDIRSLVSYAVGCMFGRYSLDMPGIAYAGGEWDASRYISFIPDADNCIPITDEEYFTDDIVGRFVEFVRVVYGAEMLEENLDFVAAALGNKGNTSREVIRNYFLNDFYKDHLKVYQKRPIYWLFDSGKQNGFKALVYMHRWNADTVGNLRVEYLHKMQTVYEHEIETCQEMIDHSSGRDVATATKRKEKLIKQLKECKDYDIKVAHIAFSKIDIDLDDGVKVNYRKVQTGADGKFCEILADSKDIMVKDK